MYRVTFSLFQINVKIKPNLLFAVKILVIFNFILTLDNFELVSFLFLHLRFLFLHLLPLFLSLNFLFHFFYFFMGE